MSALLLTFEGLGSRDRYWFLIGRKPLLLRFVKEAIL
jgi:hypothetical protein